MTYNTVQLKFANVLKEGILLLKKLDPFSETEPERVRMKDQWSEVKYMKTFDVDVEVVLFCSEDYRFLIDNYNKMDN